MYGTVLAFWAVVMYGEVLVYKVVLAYGTECVCEGQGMKYISLQ